MDSEQFEPTTQEQFATSINLRHYWHIILERRWLVITAFISVFILSLIYLFRATPIYQATARLQINREGGDVLRVEGGFAIDTREQDYLQTQYKNLLSRTLLSSVAKELKLDKEDDRYSKAADPIRALADDIDIVPLRLTRLVDIKVEHPDPEKAALIANTLVRNFKDQNLDQKIVASTEIVMRLKNEANSQKAKVEAAEKAVDDYRKSKGIVSFESSENIVLQALMQYQADLDRTRSQAALAQKTVEEVDTLLKGGADLHTIPQIRDNPEIQALRKELASLEASFAELQKRYLPMHPQYIATDTHIRALRESLATQANAVISSLRNNARLAQGSQQATAKIVDEWVAKQQELKHQAIEYSSLRRDAEQNALLYNTVLASVKERELTSRNIINNMRIVDDAAKPLKPVKPRVVLTIFLGVFGGLAIAVGLAFFVNYLDDSVKSQDDVETYLRLPFLGYVPNIKTNSVVERDLQAHLHPQSNAAEGFRTIRATVSLTHRTDKFRVLAVTSTIPSEGKSLIASNLAIVTAQTGLRTLLVDSDLRRPSVHKAYQLHSPVGLSSFLVEQVNTIDEVVHKTEVPNLDVICCGAVPSTPSELIGSKRMMEFLQLVRGRYDRVFLDCPPISAVSDPLIISAMSDGVLFVTKFNKIRREHARKSVLRLQNAGIHIVGAVLNDIDFEGRDSYYYSYYYYQNRYYSSHYKGGVGGEKRARGKKEDAAAEAAKPRNGA